MARRPVHRVQRDAAIDPAGGVAGELGVGQRRQQEAGVTQVVAIHLDDAGTFAVRQVFTGHTTNQVLGQLAWLQAFEPAAYFVAQADTYGVRGDLAVQNPLQGFRVLDGLGQQVVHFQDFDTALTHLGHEVEVVTLGLVDPDNVIEKQLVTVVRGQPLVGQARGANHDFA
ncbi:hypothetical protein D3C78_1432510 [compost metagenome]